MRLPITAAASSALRAGRAEPARARQHRVAHRRRQADAGRQHLGDEEGIARGLAMQRSRASTARPPTSRRTASSDSRGSSMRTVAFDAARSPSTWRNGVSGDLVLAIGQHQQRARAGDAPAEELHQVERRLVGPVDVLDQHEVRRLAPPHHVEHGGEQPGARRAGLERGQQIGAGLAGDVVERARAASA